MSDVNINPNSPNTVTIQNADNIITVTDTSKHTEVDITQEITDIVNVVTPGPQGTQGIQGPAGQGFDKPFTGSLIVSGSFEIIGDQTISGSLIISGSSTFTNIGPAIFSGSVTTTQGFTGSLSGTASYADMATTASHALFAVSASHEVVKEVSSSHANTADVAGGLQGQPSIYVTNITASGGISSSNGTITAITGSFNHLITDDDTIEFRNRNTGVQTGRLKFDASTGLNVQNAEGARTKIRAGRGEFLSLEAGPVGLNSLGSITASGDISSSTNIIAKSFIGTFSGGLSGSAQIASDISGAFGAVSASFSTRITANEIVTSKTLISSSAQIAADISGSFNAISSSFSTRVTTNESAINVLNSSGLISSSAQIASNISGAFSATSSSLASRTTTLETKTSYSGSFSGSFEGNGSGLTNIPAAGIVGLNLSQIASGSATASISPNLGLVVNTNVSSSATSTASFGTYLGDGSQLSNISTTPFPFTGDAVITGSLTISGSFHSFRLNSDNIILGSGSGESMEAGATNNVIIGSNSGRVLDTGDNNILIGHNIGGNLNAESNNIMIGNNIADDGNAGDENIYIGSYAGYEASNAEYNVGIGHNALKGKNGNTGDYNTAIGYQVGYDMDNGYQNSLFGYRAGYEITTGYQNVFIGASSGNSIITGNGNIAIGIAADFVGDVSGMLVIGSGSLVTISASLETGNILLQGDVSSSATSTASFGTYLGDGSQLTGIEGGAGFPFSGSAVITGSLVVSGSLVDFTSASSVLLNIESLPLVNPIVEYITTSAITSSGTTVPLPNALTFVSSSTYEYLEVFINGLRMRYDMDFIPASTASVTYQITVPSGAEVTYKSLKRP